MIQLILKGGTVLVHEADDKVVALRRDILVRGKRIHKLAEDINPTGEVEVIDCTGKIISPGFVDTHHHMWETALKGIAEDAAAPSYFATMFTAPFTMKPEDVFWGNLAGCLEAIDAGTTTALDFAHVNWSEDHAKQALAGTLTSGLRSVYAYAPTITVRQTEPTVELDELIPSWFWPQLEQLAALDVVTSRDARVRLGLGFDYYFLGEAVVRESFQKARDLGIDLVTSHCARTPGNTSESLPSLLKSYGLLDHRIVLSHLGGATQADVDLLREAKAFISASPSTEMTMGLGPPCCFRHDLTGVDVVCSLGADCHCTTSSSMVNEMRVGLLAARGNHATHHIEAKGSVPSAVCNTSESAFNMATIGGARALNMEDEIGTIAVGKKADLVVFDTSTPAMAIAAQRDPVKDIVMHSSVGDIDTVLVNGVICKRGGKLLPVRPVQWVEDKGDIERGFDTIEYGDVSAKVWETSERFAAKLKEFDSGKLAAFVKDLYQL